MNLAVVEGVTCLAVHLHLVGKGVVTNDSCRAYLDDLDAGTVYVSLILDYAVVRNLY